MNVRFRIATIRLYEKCQKKPELFKELGITAVINNNNETRDFNASIKDSENLETTD